MSCRVVVTATVVCCTATVAAAATSAEASSQSASEATSGAQTPPSAGDSMQNDVPCPAVHPPLATAAAIIPGVLLHGTGHYVAGCRVAGERLFWASLTGLGLMAAALTPAIFFGAHPYLVPIQAVVGMTGLVLFGGSWALDVYGTLVPRGIRGSHQLTPLLETSLGYRYVYDPTFNYRHFVEQGFDYWFDAWRLAPRATLSLTDHNVRYGLPVFYRVVGPTPRRQSVDASFVDVEAGVTRHDFGEEGFDVTTFELSLATRLDLQRHQPELSGTFLELGVGAGINRYVYDAPLATPDSNGVLLMGFALGGYFGSYPRGGEAKFYYDHRHDDYAAGLKVPGLGSGVAGHFGVQSRAYFTENWGVVLDAQVGSAHVFSATLLFRQGVGDETRHRADGEGAF